MAGESDFKALIVLFLVIIAVITDSNGWTFNKKGHPVLYDSREQACIPTYSYRRKIICKGYKEDECEGIGLVDDECVSSCGPHRFTQYGLCVSRCGVQFVQSGTDCLSKCASSRYLPPQSNVCELCHEECNGCFGPSASHCKECKNFIHENVCVGKCPNKTAGFGKQCVPSDYCSGYIYNSVCTEKCPLGTYVVAEEAVHYCASCHRECSGCTGPGNDKCIKCKNMIWNGTCVSNCPKNTRYIFNGKCVISCDTGYVFYQGTCQKYCPRGWFLADRKCVRECPKGLFARKNVCIKKCAGIVYQKLCFNQCPAYMVNFNGTCLRRCPHSAPYSKNGSCQASCSDYLYKQSCLSKCPGSLPSINRTCVSRCPSKYPVIDPKTKQCSKKCDFVQIWGTCRLTCPLPLLQFNHTCFETCPKDTLLFDGLCYSRCPVKTFIYQNTCISKCLDGKLLVRRESQMAKCVDRCPSEMPLKMNGICVKSCSENHDEVKNKTPWFRDKDKCVKKCPKLATLNRECVEKCPESAPYQRDGICIRDCKMPWLRDTDKCVKKCPKLATLNRKCVEKCPESAPYQRDGICVKDCMSHPETSQIDIMYKDGHKCVPKCPKYVIEDLNECKDYICPYPYLYYLGRQCVSLCPYESDQYIQNNGTHTHTEEYFTSTLASEEKYRCKPGTRKLTYSLGGISLFILLLLVFYHFYCNTHICFKEKEAISIEDLIALIHSDKNGQDIDMEDNSSLAGEAEMQIIEMMEETDDDIKLIEPSPECAGCSDVCESPLENKYDIFFCHSTDDIEWVRNSVEILEKKPYNLKCCFSDRDFTYGKYVTHNIEDSIAKSKCTVLVFSPSFLESRWCELEQNIAMVMSLSKPEFIILPVLLRPCKIPFSTKAISYIDASEEDVYEKIYSFITDGRKKGVTQFQLVFDWLKIQLGKEYLEIRLDVSRCSRFMKVDKFTDHQIQALQSRVKIPRKVLEGFRSYMTSGAVQKSYLYSCCRDPCCYRFCWTIFLIPIVLPLIVTSAYITYFNQGDNAYSLVYVLVGLRIVLPVSFLIPVIINVLYHMIKSFSGVGEAAFMKNIISNWILHNNYGLLITWRGQHSGIDIEQYDAEPCKEYIKQSDDEYLQNIQTAHEKADDKEVTFMKAMFYLYALNKINGCLPLGERRHSIHHDNFMCFCQYVEKLRPSICEEEALKFKPSFRTRLFHL